MISDWAFTYWLIGLLLLIVLLRWYIQKLEDRIGRLEFKE
jgi:hypothetical protein